MRTIGLTWTNFKADMVAKGYPVYYRTLDVGYEVFTFDQSVLWGTCVTTTEDIADFETNYKSLANVPSVPRSVEGTPKVLSSLSIDTISMYVCGKAAEITGTTNFIDSDFPETVFLQGVKLLVKNADWGDTITAEVGYIHPVNGWTAIKAFGFEVPMMDSTDWKEYHYVNNAVSMLPTQVKLRLWYNQANTGTTKKVVIQYIAHIAS